MSVVLDSILDLNSNNVWSMNEHVIAELWETEKSEGNFTSSEEKLLNVIRLAFDVVHFNPDDVRESAKYENGTWALFTHCNPGRGVIAIKRKVISRLTDLSYENIKHITAATLLELIDRNFGGGWESISLQMRDIIESGFEVTTTLLPASRIHAPGGTLEKKVKQGFDVLEVAKGTWVEAIFAKKKDPIAKMKYESIPEYDEDGNRIIRDEDESNANDFDHEDDEPQNDEGYYSNFTEEAVVKEVDDEGFPVEEN